MEYTSKKLVYDVTEVDTATLKLNGVAVTKTASEINALISTADAPEGTPVNAVAASGTLTLTDVSIDGETVTIGDDVYEFCADTAQSLTAGSDFAIDITSYATASEGELTIDTQVTSGDTMVIGTKTYTFVPNTTGNADGEIDVGTDLATCQANIVAAINGSDGVNTASTVVTASAFNTNVSTLTAIIAGTAGDSIPTTSSFTTGTNQFDGVTLGTATSGVNTICSLIQ